MFSFEPTIFKAYDIRGLYPTQVAPELGYALGQAYVKFIQPKQVAVGRDVRLSGPEIMAALIEGITDAGVDVIDIGEISTEMLYFCVGNYKYDGGIMVTASHNPAEYNGFKMVRAGAEPLTGDTGIQTLRDMIPDLLKNPIKSSQKGKITSKDFFNDYRKFVLSFIDIKTLKPMQVVGNANFGFQGQFATRVLEGLPVELVLINGEPDGAFPKGRPDPFIPENRPEFLAKIIAEKADFGVAWDADADRVFFATGQGEFLEGYYMSALLAKLLLQKYPGEKILYDVRYTWAIIDTIKESGGIAVPSRVGHSFIKQALREHNAVFCGEASGHIYFRDYYFADTGMLPFLMVLELLSVSGKTLQDLVQPLLDKYHVSGEINIKVANPDDTLAKLKEKYGDATTIDETDRLTIEYDRDWRANFRVSNTESLFRVNVEASNKELMEQKRDEILAFLDTAATA